MKAITLWQPWSWAVARAGKRIENRTWAPPRWLIGERIAIHAGKRIDRASCERLTDLGHVLPSTYVHGAVECTALIVEVVHEDSASAEVICDDWWCGPWGWLLEDVRPLAEPVPCLGRQGIWELPSEVVKEFL